jgi:hypothetical protein
MNNKEFKLTMAFDPSTEEKYNRYDKIISTTYANIFSLSKRGDIILKNFDYNCHTCRVFLEVATMVAYMTNKEIYLHTSLFEFLCARIKKKNKHIHWISQFKKKVDGIDMHVVAADEAKAFEEDTSIFCDIFKAYYEGKKN